jgi:hypothetical protein
MAMVIPPRPRFFRPVGLMVSDAAIDRQVSWCLGKRVELPLPTQLLPCRVHDQRGAPLVGIATGY